jgi:CRP-like cAMP-binding protein
MRHLIRENIDAYIQLSDQEFDLYYGLLNFKTYKKKEHILAYQEVCQEAFFILEGCMRYYHIVDGEEQTGQFFFEGAWYSDYESFLFNRPSEQSIQALEKTSVASLSKQALEKLFVEVPKFERFGRLMAENAFMGLRKRTESLTQLSAIERYNVLLKNRPKVIRRVPQKYIASYLGIQPQSLSRIRSQLSKI